MDPPKDIVGGDGWVKPPNVAPWINPGDVKIVLILVLVLAIFTLWNQYTKPVAKPAEPEWNAAMRVECVTEGCTNYGNGKPLAPGGKVIFMPPPPGFLVWRITDGTYRGK